MTVNIKGADAHGQKLSDPAKTGMAAAREAVKRNPHSAEAWTSLGSLLASQGRLEKASDCFAKALKLSPRSAAALNNLATIHQRLGQFEDAKGCYAAALRLAPDNCDIALNLASLLGTLGQFLDALEIVRRVLRQNPAMAKAHLVASAIAANLGRYTDALTGIDAAIAHAGKQLHLMTRRADILRELDQGDEALMECEAVLAKAPANAEALHVKALILRALNRADEALASFSAAETASTAPAKVIADKAWFLAELGYKAQAMDAVDVALHQQRDLAVAWYCKSFLTRYTSVTHDIVTMEKLAAKADMSHTDRLNLNFALGKAYLDIGDGEKAFANLNRGNALRRSAIDYHRAAEADQVTDIMAAFPTPRPDIPRAADAIPGRPIFVFGIPRSGTTLVEQILASHHLVSSIGEVRHLEDAGEGWIASLKSEAAPSMPPSDDWLRRYAKAVRAASCEGQPFVDKTPSNFRHAGLIFSLFPNARMIHCRRNPLDTCLSCYSLLFTHGHDYAYDMAELGHYYRLYQRLMAHWQATLPPGSILDVEYETLVDDTDAQIQRLLDYCALPWDENCLKFHETKRHVATASLDQVRSPIYKSSVGRAQRFHAWLGPLETELQAPN